MSGDNLSVEVVNQKIEIPLRFVEMKLITKRMGFIEDVTMNTIEWL